MTTWFSNNYRAARRNLSLFWGKQWRWRSRLHPRELSNNAAQYLHEHESGMFFVLGSGRSGTQLLTNLLHQNDDVCVFHEPNFNEDVGTLVEFRRNPELAVEYWRKFRSIEVYRRWSAALGARCYGEVNGTIRFQAPAIRELYPEAKLFCVCRDGRGVVRSVMGWPQFYGSASKGAYAVEPLAGDPYLDCWNDMSRFEKICWSWMDTYKYLMDCVPVENWLHLELLATDYQYCKDRFLSFLGISLTYDCWKSVVAEKSRNATRSYQFPSWENWSDDQRKSFQSICGETMSKLGYML